MSMAGTLYGFWPGDLGGRLGICFMDVSSMACGWSSLPSWASILCYHCLLEDTVLLTKSIRYRRNQAMHKEEWIM